MLSLPWELPLAEWTEHTVPVPRGLSRHVVRVIRLDGAFYAVKETQEHLAKREYRMLRELARLGLPAVSAVAVVSGRPNDQGAALVTRHLAFALPYRTVFANGLPPGGTPRLVDALVVLLVRLHLAGCYWGDVSLSNVLFRRSAGEFSAYLVDAETAELHPQLSDRMREYDVTVGCENVFAELLDVQAAEPTLARQIHPFAVIASNNERNETLWHELTAEDHFSTEEMWRIEQRVERLGELGFDVEELAMSTDPHASTVSIQPRVVEAGHHARELDRLTGLEVEDNQARRLLADLASYMAHHGLTDRVAAGRRWRREIYDAIVGMGPPDLGGRLEPAEVFHQILEHRWLLSERAGREIDIFDTARDYFATVFGKLPDEKLGAAD
jgi:hypothetical protein